MKKIIILIIIVVLTLGGGAVYFFIFNNNAEEELVSEINGNDFLDSLTDSIQPNIITLDTVIIVDEPQMEDAINTQALIDSFNNQLMLQENILNEYKYKNEQLLNELELSKKQIISIKDLAKTYESMKPDEMKPILTNLDDGTVIAIYNSMSGRSKKLIFKALNPKRAAEITKLLAGVKKED